MERVVCIARWASVPRGRNVRSSGLNEEGIVHEIFVVNMGNDCERTDRFGGI